LGDVILGGATIMEAVVNLTVAVVTTLMINVIKAVLIENDCAARARKPAPANRRQAFFIPPFTR